MQLNKNIEIDNSIIEKNVIKMINQIYKLLPNREEGLEWQLPLDTVIEELGGLNRLIPNQEVLFSVLCKLEGLHILTEEEDFQLFRRTIFECLNLLGVFRKEVLLCL